MRWSSIVLGTKPEYYWSKEQIWDRVLLLRITCNSTFLDKTTQRLL